MASTHQRWIGFTVFAEGIRGEIGRGGAYSVVHPDGATEPAVGFSLYLDGLVDAGLGVVARRRIALPAATPRDVAARLRAAGWTTVALLDSDAPPGDCSHRWDGVRRRTRIGRFVMTQIAVIVGSLRRASFSRRLAEALVAVAPDGLVFDAVPLGRPTALQSGFRRR